MDLNAELERRHANVRAAIAEHDLDALVVSKNEYTGFEGAVTYLSGTRSCTARTSWCRRTATPIVFPAEARYVGEHGTARLEQVFPDRPGEHIAGRARKTRSCADRRLRPRYVMAVRDYHGLASVDGVEVVPFDVEFDLARAVKSDAEIESVRDSCGSASAGSRSSSKAATRPGVPRRRRWRRRRVVRRRAAGG